MRFALVLSLILASAVASADPITFGIGVGVRQQTLAQDLKASPQAAPIVDPSDTSASVTALVGYRVRPWLAVGARFGIGQLDVQKRWGYSSAGPEYDGYIRTPVDVALTAQLEWKRLWLAPWIGVQAMHEVDQNRVVDGVMDGAYDVRNGWSTHLAVGVTAGVDVYEHAGNRVAIYVDVEHSTGGYSAVSFGLAYRR